MNAILKLPIVTVAAALVSLPIAGSAHHSMTEFGRDVVIEIEGVMSKVSWRNPHILYELTSTDDTGGGDDLASRRQCREFAAPPRPDG